MKVYKHNALQITISTGTFVADENGIIDIPDNQVTSAVWSQGFVHAKGRLAQLERERTEAAAAKAAAAPVAAKASKPVDDEAAAAQVEKPAHSTVAASSKAAPSKNTDNTGK